LTDNLCQKIAISGPFDSQFIKKIRIYELKSDSLK